MAISKKTRFEVFKRDKFSCVYCGAKPTESELEIDHFTPKCKGGGDDIANLVTSCFNCNRGKSGRVIGDESCLQVAERLQHAAIKAAILHAIRLKVDAEMEKAFRSLVRKIQRGWDCKLTDSQKTSLRTFSRKLGPNDISDSAAIANDSRRGEARWKYFCGVCWTKIRKDEESE